MPFTTTSDKQEIYYEKTGSSGPVLVLVSGYMGIADIWQPLINKLQLQYQCIAYDSRGFGRSSKPELALAYSIERHAEDLHAVLESLNLNSKVILVTHSMGTNIASAFFLSNPDRVSGIISSAAYFDGKSIGNQGLGAEHLAISVDVPSACVEFYTNMGLDHRFAIEAAKWPGYTRRNNALALFAYDIGNRYSEITVPCLIIQGAEDMVCPVDQCARPIAEAIPDCKLEVLEGVKHFPITEAVEKVFTLINTFCQTLT
ncbi:alpha/beta fold family hydrolase [Penicillium hordei]|jgi:Predicted hydrolases or acyltransferases (alpha/beta hydrolase superfamily)|uniref:Alpha/beta fold family hydrolase n=1 Tax=Penicillium hordei TaxID=40994 RepID=A0AAD6DNA0_9EURO|nr:alpha/beta fold family hydrolase [Penicillium hordei]KAJ5589563.1 alpha/beta fold family hydrolase [Penicillium hordei]